MELPYFHQSSCRRRSVLLYLAPRFRSSDSPEWAATGSADMQVRVFCSVDHRPLGNTSQAGRCTLKLVVGRSA